MDRFKSILVAMTPGRLDAVSLRRVGELAAVNQASVTLLDVAEPLPERRRIVTIDGRRVHVERLLVREREHRLRQLAELTGVIDAERVVKIGKAFVEVIRYAMSNECDIVIVGEPAPGKTRPGGISAGVMRLMRKCPVPVWVMRPSRARTLRVMALVDPDSSDHVRDELNDRVLQLATSMALRHEGELHVAHAWQVPGEAMLASSSLVSLPQSELKVIVESEAAEHKEQLDALTRAHNIGAAGGRTHLVKGDAGVVLPELADRLKINLIVMGTVARTGLSGLIMGNTAETILRTVDCSVLAVKPQGFRTPVRVGRGAKKKTA